MPATHLYPDPAASGPNFMFGQFDLDHADPGSPAVLGEALLSVQRDDPPYPYPPHVHHHAGSEQPWCPSPAWYEIANGPAMLGIFIPFPRQPE